jgi:hypothetical protein
VRRLTNELGSNAGNGRTTSGREIVNGRTENREFNGRQDNNKSLRRGNGNINAGGVHLAVREHRDRAFVVGFARILVNQFMQRGTRRHCVQEQDKANQQRGDNRLAVRFEMASHKSQTVCF